MEEERKIYTVGQVNVGLKYLVEKSFSGIFVRGEISNFKQNSISGHMYFSLKDPDGNTLSCVMFKYNANYLRFVPKDGSNVLAFGKLSVYQKTGYCQLVVETLEEDGIGDLAIKFEKLKKKLEEEGLFKDENKIPLPKLPSVIGIVTSPTGAAIRDMIKIILARYPLAKVVLYPAQVQGVGSANTIIEGINYFNNTKSVDVIIIGRGGGSIEDLWEFNDENLVRTVASSVLPIISAVGHESDTTLCDYAADVRASTPSNAAELVVPSKDFLNSVINGMLDKMVNHISKEIKNEKTTISLIEDSIYRIENSKLTILKEKVKNFENCKVLKNPREIVQIKSMNLDSLQEKIAILMNKEILNTRQLIDKYTTGINNDINNVANKKKSEFKIAVGKLYSLDPLAIISRGYSATFDENGNVVNSVKKVSVGDNLILKLHDGDIKTQVIDKKGKR